MAIAARKAFSESAPVRVWRPAPRPADETDLAGPSAVQNHQQALEAAFAARNAHPRLRAATLSLLTLASVGLWAAIIIAAIHVGRMVTP
jgi:hypothetical protein